MRLKTKKRLIQLKETLELLDEESQGFSAPKKVFVEEDKWNVEVDGAFDQEKVVEEFIFGKKRKGIWKVVGREGVWDFKDSQGRTVRKTSVEESGRKDIAGGAIEAKS